MKTTNRLNLKGQLRERELKIERAKGILRRKIKTLNRRIDKEKNIHLNQLLGKGLEAYKDALDLLEEM